MINQIFFLLSIVDLTKRRIGKLLETNAGEVSCNLKSVLDDDVDALNAFKLLLISLLICSYFFLLRGKNSINYVLFNLI